MTVDSSQQPDTGIACIMDLHSCAQHTAQHSAEGGSENPQSTVCCAHWLTPAALSSSLQITAIKWNTHALSGWLLLADETIKGAPQDTH